MSVASIAKDILKDVQNLLAFPYAILFLAFLAGSNIALARGFGISLPHATWEAMQRQVSVGEALLFLCLMIFYMTVVSAAMQWLFVFLSLSPIRKIRDWFRALSRTSTEVRLREGYVFRSEILKKANGEASSYYRDIYREHERAIEEAETEERQLSSHVLGTVVLLLIDIALDRDQALPVYAYIALRDKLAGFIAVGFLSLVSIALLAALIAPILSDSPIWIYCPGFPKKSESDDTGAVRTL